MTKKTKVTIVNKLRIEKLKSYLTTSNTLKTIIYIYIYKLKKNNETMIPIGKTRIYTHQQRITHIIIK